MSPEPFVSRAKALQAERSEKCYGDEKGQAHFFSFPRLLGGSDEILRLKSVRVQRDRGFD